jgi:hypothetical protein
MYVWDGEWGGEGIPEFFLSLIQSYIILWLGLQYIVLAYAALILYEGGNEEQAILSREKIGNFRIFKYV